MPAMHECALTSALTTWQHNAMRELLEHTYHPNALTMFRLVTQTTTVHHCAGMWAVHAVLMSSASCTQPHLCALSVQLVCLSRHASAHPEAYYTCGIAAAQSLCCAIPALALHMGPSMRRRNSAHGAVHAEEQQRTWGRPCGGATAHMLQL